MNTIRHGIIRPIAALAVVAALGACAATKEVAMEKAPPASAVLPDPLLMQKGQSGEVDRVYLNPDVKWASYTKMILDPVTIWTGPGSDMAKASPKVQKALADSFYTDLYNAASTRCQMVTEASPGTMRWHVALVDATSANPFLNTLSTYGELLWEGADERAGTKALHRNTFNSWDDVDNAFKAWAEQFAKRLGELGACPR
jgi:hypothetical protein